MEKQPQTPDQPASEPDPDPRPDQTLMFNPQTRSYDVRQKTPTELQQDRERTQSEQQSGPTSQAVHAVRRSDRVES
jgi:hypothetical protein